MLSPERWHDVRRCLGTDDDLPFLKNVLYLERGHGGRSARWFSVADPQGSFLGHEKPPLMVPHGGNLAHHTKSVRREEGQLLNLHVPRESVDREPHLS